MSEDDKRSLLACEQARCRALVAGDTQALANLLDERYIHTHTRGNFDTRESYLRYVNEVLLFRAVDRTDDLEVRLYGSVATMIGTQINTASLRSNPDEVVEVRSRVLQVWSKRDGAWRQVAFQATALEPPRPIVDYAVSKS